MDAHALAVLEFDKVRRLLAESAASSLGLAAAEALAPSSHPSEVAEWQQETAEARRIRDAGDDIPLGGLHDIGPLLRQARRGGLLLGGELLEIGETLRCIARLQSFFAERDQLPRLRQIALDLIAAPALQADIERCVAPDGTVADQASPALARWRRQVAVLGSRIEQHLQGLLADLARNEAVQEALITIREGRYCVPVKSSHRGKFDGIVHDRSASGQTVFMEPTSVVRLNNELREAQLAEKAEVERILAELSDAVAAEATPLEGNLRLLTILDLARARGTLSARLDAAAPEFDETGCWDLVAARHPLLVVDPAQRVVPIDILLGEAFDVLLVTGPNTGGKTVALKTLGLLTLMAAAGLHIPAEPGSRVARCGNVFADIGDEQSIEQSLSTFGSHLRQVVAILQRAETGDLVLLDELGAGTDPTEGAALAQAVLGELLARGCRVMATTHHGVLKDFAYATARVENASVAFDKQSLAPTYRLLIGIPGASHAFDIASRYGMADEVLDAARLLLPEDHRQAADILGQMEASRRKLDLELREAEQEAAGVSHQRRELERERRRLRELEQTLREEARAEAEALLGRLQREADGILKALRSAEREGRQTEGARQRLKSLSAALSAPPPEAPTPAADPNAVRAGDTVLVARLQREGTVLAVDGEELQIQVGPMRMTVAPGDVSLVRRGQPPKVKSGGRRDVASWGVEAELHLRGETVDDALILLDRYLDQAILSNRPEVRIVHGKGSGTLRRAVHDFLRDHPHVAGYTHPPENQGGQGVTVATIRG